MNDDEVNSILEPPYDHRNAYMLFYMRDNDSLETAVAQATAASSEGPPKSFSSIGKKRAREDGDIEEDIGKPVRQALFSSSGAGPSNPGVGTKVNGMLPKQDHQPQPFHSAKPSIVRPPQSQSPDSEDDKGRVESPHFHKKAKLNVGVTFNKEGDGAEGKKKKKKKPRGNSFKSSSFSLSDKQPSLDLPGVSSDHEEELGTADLANKAVILSGPPLSPSTSPSAAGPSPPKKRKLVDYSSEGENGPTDSDDGDSDRRMKVSSPASSVSPPLEREHEEAISSERLPGSVFAPSSSSTQQQWDDLHKPKKQKYMSLSKREQKRKKGLNPYGMAGHQAGGSASIGGNTRRRPGGI
jgi:hypothetical protein